MMRRSIGQPDGQPGGASGYPACFWRHCLHPWSRPRDAQTLHPKWSQGKKERQAQSFPIKIPFLIIQLRKYFGSGGLNRPCFCCLTSGLPALLPRLPFLHPLRMMRAVTKTNKEGSKGCRAILIIDCPFPFPFAVGGTRRHARL